MKTLDILRQRINACDTLIDYVLDDIPHARQQPILDELRELRSNFDFDLLSLKEEKNEDSFDFSKASHVMRLCGYGSLPGGQDVILNAEAKEAAQ